MWHASRGWAPLAYTRDREQHRACLVSVVRGNILGRHIRAGAPAVAGNGACLCRPAGRQAGRTRHSGSDAASTEHTRAPCTLAHPVASTERLVRTSGKTSTVLTLFVLSVPHSGRRPTHVSGGAPTYMAKHQTVKILAGYRRKWEASRSDRFDPIPGTHLVGGCVGSRIGLEYMEDGIICCTD
jgi:hypothetical protein